MTDKPWTKPAIRETMKQSRRIERAQEELICCSVEARRLHTSIRDEELQFKIVLARLKSEGSRIYGAVAEYCERRRNINAQHLLRLEKLYALDGFKGAPSPGIRKGTHYQRELNASKSTTHPYNEDGVMPVPSLAAREDDILAEEDIEEDSANDEGEAEIDALVDFVSNLAVQQ